MNVELSATDLEYDGPYNTRDAPEQYESVGFTPRLDQLAMSADAWVDLPHPNTEYDSVAAANRQTSESVTHYAFVAVSQHPESGDHAVRIGVAVHVSHGAGDVWPAREWTGLTRVEAIDLHDRLCEILGVENQWKPNRDAQRSLGDFIADTQE